jgi:hypothetical protein
MSKQKPKDIGKTYDMELQALGEAGILSEVSEVHQEAPGPS